MIGIYKITNKINQHCYIGQSTQIERRWANHKSYAFNPNNQEYEYPLYRAFRKYGIENFIFEILEECSNEELNSREQYWINFYNPEYNQTIGENYQIIPQKLTEEQVLEIQNLLIQDKEGNISHKELAEHYGVHKDTIRDINVGRTWCNSKLTYPLHISKYDSTYKQKQKFYCIDCGKEISRNSTRCSLCEAKNKIIPLEEMLVTREELKDMIRTISFTEIGRKLGYSDNTIRKWCTKFNLPRTKKEINSYSDEEWNLI